MIIKMYSVRDIKNDFGMPFTAANDEVAIRMFKATANDKTSTLALFPADFELWCVGEFNTNNGGINNTCYPIALDGGNND